MKFTSILFALLASLFLVESTLAMPAPKCNRKCENKKERVRGKKLVDKLERPDRIRGGDIWS
jgi:hypothetical protein